jgi:uncharacterized membrane protein
MSGKACDIQQRNLGYSDIIVKTAHLLQSSHHLLGSLLAIARTMHGIVDYKVVYTQLVDNLGIGLVPVLVKVLGDDGKVLLFFLSRYRDRLSLGSSSQEMEH